MALRGGISADAWAIRRRSWSHLSTFGPDSRKIDLCNTTTKSLRWKGLGNTAAKTAKEIMSVSLWSRTCKSQPPRKSTTPDFNAKIHPRFRSQFLSAKVNHGKKVWLLRIETNMATMQSRASRGSATISCPRGSPRGGFCGRAGTRSSDAATGL